MKKFKLFLIALLVVLLVSCSNNKDSNMLEATGNIEATNVTVSSKSIGEVIQLNKNEGDIVSAGDTIMIIDHANLEIQQSQAEAALMQAEAQFNLLKNGARKEDIAQGEEQLNSAKANFENSKNDYERMTKLYESNSVTKKQLEDIQNKYNVTLSQFNAAKQNYSKLKNFARPEELKQAEANYLRQKSSLDLIKKSIKDSYVISPINGIIVKKFVEKGETVTNMSSLFKVADLSKVQLVIYISEEELGRVKLGQTADVKVDAFKDKTFSGKVIYISPEAEFTPKNIQTKDERTKLVFAVKLELANPKQELKEGMPADAFINVK